VGNRSAAGRGTWRKECESGACLEIARDGETVMMRNSAHPDVVVFLTNNEWANFIASAKKGSFDDL
jgi:hypothetical protein